MSSPTCLSWSEVSMAWEEGGIGVDTVSEGVDGAAVVTCRTYHLSVFATSEEGDSISAELNTVDLLDGHSVLRQVCSAKPSLAQNKTSCFRE